MFDSWISDFKRAISNTITEYVLLVVAVVPFLVAAGFATAAVVIWLTSVLGTTAAYLVIAAAFAVIGIGILMVAKSYEKPAEPVQPEAKTQKEAAAEASILGGSLGTIAGLIFAHPGMAWSTLKIAVRNLPALIAGGVLGGLLYSDSRGPRPSIRASDPRYTSRH